MGEEGQAHDCMSRGVLGRAGVLTRYFSPRDVQQYLETVLVVPPQSGVVGIGGWRPGTLLNTMRCPGQPHHRG